MIKSSIGWLLGQIFTFTNHYALSIILLTIIVKFVILPLTLAQMKSQKSMSEVQPKIQELQKKYKDDKETLNQKTLELYKEHKVNPLAGCLPLIIQMPIIFALFTVLREPTQYVFGGNESLALEATSQVFLWIKNFAEPDKLYAVLKFEWAKSIPGLLPMLASILTYFQFKTMGTTTQSDNETANRMNKNMQMMFPLMILVFGNSISAGVALYWVVSTAFQMVQQILLKPKSTKEAQI
ncbi:MULTISPECIES: YidC/Oxa1 family membrane protein insertase [unclassified Fusibacter]|uniref:YidC/Oxa1 family membrane protein insertase n=1 Tax=unclassified Fusibacter TaxID=2624464 RepID=UPI001A9C14E0|nr:MULTISPECIES: YidC/Oxa1 family membrane protein insertase [unclassified Fusibacter]MCK8060851.1 YidC/Oxa1 family membrane protein insertase [Fusibacter sp. A2]